MCYQVTCIDRANDSFGVISVSAITSDRPAVVRVASCCCSLPYRLVSTIVVTRTPTNHCVICQSSSGPQLKLYSPSIANVFPFQGPRGPQCAINDRSAVGVNTIATTATLPLTLALTRQALTNLQVLGEVLVLYDVLRLHGLASPPESFLRPARTPTTKTKDVHQQSMQLDQH